jgi:hypothetical protein
MSRPSGLLTLAALSACGTSTAGPADDVMVNLASVTLGDDCGGRLPAPVIQKADSEKRDEAKRRPDASADADGWGDFGCAQTSMQLSITTHPQLKATGIKIKKVELLDDKGKLLEMLVASKPSKWTGKAYAAWNESVTANERTVTSYLLSTPTWNKLGGRRTAHTKKFQLRVTLGVGAKDRTIEKKVTASAYIEPDVDT